MADLLMQASDIQLSRRHCAFYADSLRYRGGNGAAVGFRDLADVFIASVLMSKMSAAEYPAHQFLVA